LGLGFGMGLCHVYAKGLWGKRPFTTGVKTFSKGGVNPCDIKGKDDHRSGTPGRFRGGKVGVQMPKNGRGIRKKRHRETISGREEAGRKKGTLTFHAEKGGVFQGFLMDLLRRILKVRGGTPGYWLGGGGGGEITFISEQN